MAAEIMIALVAAVVAALLTFIIQAWIIRASDAATLLNEQIVQIGRLEKIAIEFWSCDADQDFRSLQCQQAEIEGVLAATSHFLDAADPILGMRRVRYKQLDDEVFDAITGGDFASHSRRSDPDRVRNIIVSCGSQCSLLRHARRNILWLK